MADKDLFHLSGGDSVRGSISVASSVSAHSVRVTVVVEVLSVTVGSEPWSRDGYGIDKALLHRAEEDGGPGGHGRRTQIAPASHRLAAVRRPSRAQRCLTFRDSDFIDEDRLDRRRLRTDMFSRHWPAALGLPPVVDHRPPEVQAGPLECVRVAALAGQE